MNWINIKDKVPENNNRVIICCVGDINDYGCYCQMNQS